MFAAAMTPAVQATGAAIARATPVMLRTASFAAVITASGYVNYVLNKEIIDPFVQRRLERLSGWIDRRSIRVVTRRKARNAPLVQAEIDRQAAEGLLIVPAAVRRRTPGVTPPVQPTTVDGEATPAEAVLSAVDPAVATA